MVSRKNREERESKMGYLVEIISASPGDECGHDNSAEAEEILLPLYRWVVLATAWEQTSLHNPAEICELWDERYFGHVWKLT
jgi:hypothetical protein